MHIRDFVDRNTWKDNGGDIGTLRADGDQLDRHPAARDPSAAG